MPKIITMGELLVDFTPNNVVSENGSPIFSQNAGGSPANVAVQVSRLGVKSGFIGKIGKDAFGDFLKEQLELYNVNTDGIIGDSKHNTALSFVNIDSKGHRKFSFYRENTADLYFKPEEVRTYLIDKCELFHFGALSMNSEPSRAATLKAIKYAKNKGKIISYDPNWRKALWKSEDEAMEVMRSVLDYCDIVKVSEDELSMLSDHDKIFQGVAELLKHKIKVVIVTLGEKGCIVASEQNIERLRTYKAKSIDTTGAGDSFFGGFLYGLIAKGKTLEEMTIHDFYTYADFGNACGALSTTKIGAISSYPTLEEVNTFMSESIKI